MKKHLARTFNKTIWLPTIISAEEFVQELSGLQMAEEIDLICHLYESYRHCYGNDAEPFDSFVKWGQLILQDFNEIDRYLADPEQLYENLREIKVIENWSLAEEKLTEHQNNYLRFMGSLGAIYKHYSSFLVKNGWGYQGLLYREAAKQCSQSAFPHRFHRIVLCGFNALNAAELQIFKYLINQKKADILWDADRYYLDDLKQEAGLFMRRNFEFFAQKETHFIEENFKSEKKIAVISVPKQIGQAQVVKQCLQKLIHDGVPLDQVAVVLANEKLLWPVLQQLPAEVSSVNITMEYPVKYSSTYVFIDQLIQIQAAFLKQKQQNKTIYHKDLAGLFRQPVMKTYTRAVAPAIQLGTVTEHLTGRNISFVTQENLRAVLGDHYSQLSPLLLPAATGAAFTDRIQKVLTTVAGWYADNLSADNRQLELEYLHILLRNFNRLAKLIEQYPQFNDLSAFRQLFSQVVGSSTAPFLGEPLSGLQIMGVLETRTLDFDHLIMVNVNEGVLPAGKTVNSFIPNDLKRAFGLPLYVEKDAIYAYHFYRLLQKARDVTIIYDSETDTFGKGEKSRFVTQLQLEMQSYNPKIAITESVASYSDLPLKAPHEILLHKNETNLRAIMTKATSAEKYGSLSPSALTSFKDCSLKFYFRYGVHLKETEEVEESAEANTFGSILHLSLEKLYKQFTGRIVPYEELSLQLAKIEDNVNGCFLEYFESQPAGKNILQKEVISVYVKKLLKSDLAFIKRLSEAGHHLTLYALEREFMASLDIPSGAGATTIFVKGKVDRIDICSGSYRIIDYKSSVKETDKFVFQGFANLFHDKNYDKQLQLFIYAWLLFRNGLCEPRQLQPAIVPFKVFMEEPKYIVSADKKNLVFTRSLLEEFEEELKNFIAGIFDMELPFKQTQDRKICEYCSYNVVCNFHP